MKSYPNETLTECDLMTALKMEAVSRESLTIQVLVWRKTAGLRNKAERSMMVVRVHHTTVDLQ